MTDVEVLKVGNWKPVSGYEGIYEVSDDGRVRSLDRVAPHKTSQRRWEGRELVAAPGSKNYLTVSLCFGGSQKTFHVHRLVCEAFHGPRPFTTAQVRHLDGDQRNNVAANLAWGTAADNMQDRLRHGTNPMANMTHCHSGHEYTPENTYIRKGRPGRECRACYRARKRINRAKRRAA